MVTSGAALAVLGNHDHWTDAALITDLFRAEGIKVLVNEGMRFEHKGAAFWLAGVDDTMVGLEDLPLALAGLSALGHRGAVARIDVLTAEQQKYLASWEMGT